MNKQELINAVAEKGGIDKKTAAVAVNTAITTITEKLTEGEKVQLMGFGTFEVKEMAAHIGRDPRTGASIEIKASKRPAFSAGKSLKDAVNK